MSAAQAELQTEDEYDGVLGCSEGVDRATEILVSSWATQALTNGDAKRLIKGEEKRIARGQGVFWMELQLVRDVQRGLSVEDSIREGVMTNSVNATCISRMRSMGYI